MLDVPLDWSANEGLQTHISLSMTHNLVCPVNQNIQSQPIHLAKKGNHKPVCLTGWLDYLQHGTTSSTSPQKASCKTWAPLNAKGLWKDPSAWRTCTRAVPNPCRNENCSKQMRQAHQGTPIARDAQYHRLSNQIQLVDQTLDLHSQEFCPHCAPTCGAQAMHVRISKQLHWLLAHPQP